MNDLQKYIQKYDNIESNLSNNIYEENNILSDLK